MRMLLHFADHDPIPLADAMAGAVDTPDAPGTPTILVRFTRPDGSAYTVDEWLGNWDEVVGMTPVFTDGRAIPVEFDHPITGLEWV